MLINHSIFFTSFFTTLFHPGAFLIYTMMMGFIGNCSIYPSAHSPNPAPRQAGQGGDGVGDWGDRELARALRPDLVDRRRAAQNE